MPSFVITRLDVGPDELAEVLPLHARVVRVMPGSDRADYVLCYVEEPVPFRPGAEFDPIRAQTEFSTQDAQGILIGVQGLVVCTRLVGDTFHAGMKDLAINIAYVIDNSLTRDTTVDFAKLEFVAVGFADDAAELPLPGEAVAPTAPPSG